MRKNRGKKRIKMIKKEEQISELEDKRVEITETEHNKENIIKRNRYSLRDCWDNIKCTNI